MGQVDLSNVISISVSEAQLGVQELNTSNLALFTNDAPAQSFGSLGYALYLSPQQGGTDFGTGSETYGMLDSIFSQQPNVLANNGYVAVITYLPCTQTLTFSGAPASGSFTLQINGSQSVVVTATESVSAVQTAIQALSGLAQVTCTSSQSLISAGSPVTLTFYGVHTQAIVTVSGNTLETGGSVAVTVTPAITQASETLSQAIARTSGLVQYFGILTDQLIDDMGSAEVLGAASAIQALNKIALFVSNQSSQLGSSGIISAFKTGTLTQSRGLYYGDTSASGRSNALGMMAAYAGRAFSTNFNGSNTTQTMHLKPLIGVQPDPSMTQTILTEALTAGADTYVSIAGLNGVFCSGANSYFDRVYNLQAFVSALQVAGTNFLAQSATKIPQTESGMSGLKNAYRQVCQQYVGNGYLAPGTWTDSTTFGIQQDFFNNISSYGFYLYSAPISQQTAAARAARQATLCQLAAKEAGAIQDSDLLIYVNA